jgi:hypothetical protein
MRRNTMTTAGLIGKINPNVDIVASPSVGMNLDGRLEVFFVDETANLW